MVEGCLEWQEHGLGEPESVRAATNQYRAEMDTLAAFIEDRCVVREGAVAPATPLYKQYQMWCDDAGEKPDTQKMFGMRLRERGFVNDKIKRGPHKDRKGWFGIGLRADHPDPDNGDKGDDGPSGGAGAGDKGPLSERSADHRPLGESCLSKPDTLGASASSGQSGPKNQNPSYQSPRVEKDSEKRSASSADTGITPEQEAQIRSSSEMAGPKKRHVRRSSAKDG